MTIETSPAPSSSGLAWVIGGAFALAMTTTVVGIRFLHSDAAVWNVPWAVTVGACAAVALWRWGRLADGRIATPSCLWLGGLVLGVLRTHRFELRSAWWELVVAALSTLAFVATLRPTRTSVAAVGGFAVVALAAALTVHHEGLGGSATSYVALGAGAVLVARLAADGRDALAVLVAMATTGAYWLARVDPRYGVRFRVVPDPPGAADAFAALGLLVTAWRAGARIAASRLTSDLDRGVRLVVAIQRHPWLTSVVVGAVVALLLPARWLDVAPLTYEVIPRETWWPDSRPLLPLAPALFAFLAYGVRGGRASSDRLAPWLGAHVLVAIVAIRLGATASWSSWITWDLLALIPLTAAIVLPVPSKPRAWLSDAALWLAVAIIFVPYVTVERNGPIIVSVHEWIRVVIVVLAFHAAVCSPAPSGGILFGAFAVGVVYQLVEPFRPGPTHWWSRSYESERMQDDLGAPIAWSVAGLLVVAARRVRSMTAVPRDHTIVEDLGGR